MMGSAISCSSIETLDSSVSHHPERQRLVVDEVKPESTSRKEQSIDQLKDASDKTPEPAAAPAGLEEEQRLNCSWCQSQFEAARQDAAGPLPLPITEPDKDEGKDSCSSIGGLSIVSEAERSASSNNLLPPSRLAGSSWNCFLRQDASDICNLTGSLFQEGNEFLTSLDVIDQRSVSCNFPEGSPAFLHPHDITDYTAIAKESMGSQDAPDPDCDSISSTRSVSQSISEKNEDAVSFDETSLLVNLRSASICSACGSEYDDENVSLPEEDYLVVDEVELKKYEVLGNLRNYLNAGCCEDADSKQKHDRESPDLSAISLPDKSWNQLDSETVTLMDLLERLSHILTEKAKKLMAEQRLQSRSPHPLRGLKASGATIKRVEHRKRVITVQDGASQFRIRGKLSCLCRYQLLCIGEGNALRAGTRRCYLI